MAWKAPKRGQLLRYSLFLLCDFLFMIEMKEALFPYCDLIGLNCDFRPVPGKKKSRPPSFRTPI